MIRTDTDEEAMRDSLEEVVELFELAQGSVFKLMASVSRPQPAPVLYFLTFDSGLGTQVPSQRSIRGSPSRA
jgi:hypothetical protein